MLYILGADVLEISNSPSLSTLMLLAGCNYSFLIDYSFVFWFGVYSIFTA